MILKEARNSPYAMTGAVIRCIVTFANCISGLPFKIPEWKWERITMDSVTGLLVTATKKDIVWVIVDRLTKCSHFFLQAR
ncbi:DNA/RNA polymerases superfamily protein [Gossypium australe]|uniref:DNA/RNA polymerases superfamily protein n=1 Tax=Gossypium australe TaxID=47621 RepID=A0A5B6VBA9_9ROSI|nr:DNA/RNA polymerases superfamily protein [Gossypium australe]